MEDSKVDRVRSEYQSVMRKRQADMDDKSSATTNKRSNANQSCDLSHANA